MEGDVRMPAILPKRNGICDHCNGALIQRSDDALATVKVRLALYEKETVPIINYYRQQGVLMDFALTSGVADMWPMLHQKLRDWDARQV
jgi:adenylate kinase